MATNESNALIGSGNTYTIEWSWGQRSDLLFDPTKDVLDFGWLGSSDFTLSELNGSVVISIPSNNQSYTLTGVTFADLSEANILAKSDSTNVIWQNRFGNDTSTDIAPSPAPATTQVTGTVPVTADVQGGFEVTWAWNKNVVVDFDPNTDKVDFGWFAPDNFKISEVDGSVLISVPSNQQSYLLAGVSLSDLSESNIIAKDPAVNAKWAATLGAQDLTTPEAEDIVEPAPVEPAPVEPAPVEPAPVEPAPVEPAPVEPAPVEPAPVEPAPVEPAPVEPVVGVVTPVSSPIIAGYFPEWAIYGRDFNIADVPVENLTHLIYAFSKIDSAGRMALFDPYAAVEKTFSAADSVDGIADTWDQTLAGNFNQLAELKALNPDLSNLIAVGGWTLSGTFSDVASTEAGRTNFANSVTDFLKTYTMFDGVDFDWEYPGGGGLESNIIRPEDGENYALLLGAVRANLDALEAETGRDYEISVASPAGADKIANFNLEGLAPYVDFFNLMAYDFHGGWEDITGHQAPMFDTVGGDYDVTTAVDLYLQSGVAAAQIVLGAPAYTRAWGGVSDGGDGGWNASSSQPAQGTWERGIYDYKDMAEKVMDPDLDWQLYWDDEAQAAYAFSESESVFSTFETPTSIAMKSQWAQSKGLGGMMFWDLSGDISDGAESLINAAYDSWYEGATVDQISDASILQPDIVLGGNGLMDSFVDYVYSPPENSMVKLEQSEPSNEPGLGSTDQSTDGVSTTITWSWGSDQILQFNPAQDTLNFGWIGADSFDLSEQNGSVVIALPSNDQTYVLEGVAISDMSVSNIMSLDAATTAEWSAFLG